MLLTLEQIETAAGNSFAPASDVKNVTLDVGKQAFSATITFQTFTDSSDDSIVSSELTVTCVRGVVTEINLKPVSDICNTASSADGVIDGLEDMLSQTSKFAGMLQHLMTELEPLEDLGFGSAA
jgi:hypothetical protein